MTVNEQTDQLSEVVFLLKKLDGALLPEGLKEQIKLKLKRLRRTARQGQLSGEYESVSKYIDWCLAVPWGRFVPDVTDIVNAKKQMDTLFFGRDDVKEVIMEYLSIIARKASMGKSDYVAPVLAFVGVQGAGKTTLAKAIAKVLGRPFFRIPLGAIGSSAEVRGMSPEVLSSQPGQIIRSLVKSGCCNPVILLDEFDKVSGNEDLRKDFMSMMLEILDPQQNYAFKDQYIDYPVDLSKVLFIITANRFTTISRELLDRLEIIEFMDYTPEEKTVIAKNFLFPKALDYAGLTVGELQIADDVWPLFTRTYGNSQGVRRYERNLQRLCRKTLKRIMLGEITSLVINSTNAESYVNDVMTDIETLRDIDYTELNKQS